MKIKCVACGRRIKPTPRGKRCPECQHQHRLQTWREYRKSGKGKENDRRYYLSHKEKWREYRERNRGRIRQNERQYRERNRERIQRYQRLYSVYYALRHPFRHTHDKSNDLTIENGRVKGAVWLESQIGRKSVAKNYWRRSFFQRRYEEALCNCGSLQTPFFVAIENHRRFCSECGGKIIIASENDHYTITEIVCSFCGLVLPPS